MKARIITGGTGWLIGVALIASVVSLPASFLSAATPDIRESIALSPANEQYDLTAGQEIAGELTVVNDGNVDYDFMVYARPYSINDTAYEKPNFETDTSHADVYKWVKFPEMNWSLKAGESVKIPYTITVPENAAPGGHYGVLFAETQPSAPSDTAVIRKKRVGSIVYATVKGEYKTGGEVVSSTIPGFQSDPPLSTRLSIKNTGNTHFQATTRLKVKDFFGNVKFQDEKEHFVLPDTTRDISMKWEKAPWFGLYRTELATNFLDKNFSKAGFVLIAPIWLLAVVALAVVGLIVYVFVRRR